MTFGEAVRAVVRRYADFDGRAGRPELWWWLLFVALVAAALNLFTVVPIGGLVVIGMLWAQPAVEVHDVAESTA